MRGLEAACENWVWHINYCVCVQFFHFRCVLKLNTQVNEKQLPTATD